MEAKWWLNSALGERLFDGYRIGFDFGGTSVGAECYVWMKRRHAETSTTRLAGQGGVL